MKITNSILSLVLLLLLSNVSFAQSNEIQVPEKYRFSTIVIDAGHGGHDSGTTGKHFKEKELALRYALELGKRIKEEFPEVTVLYTRTTDQFVPLKERAQFANRNQADLFISIHCNGGSHSAYGTETFVLGLHRTEDNLKVAMRENTSILLEDDYNKHYGNFDPNSPEAYILFNLQQNANLDQSIQIASKIESQFSSIGRRSRGVKQAGFLVLRETTMPSILVETGFLTNPSEESYLSSQKARTELSSALLLAIRDYKLKIDLEAKRIIDKQKAKQEEIKEAKRIEEAKKNWAWPRKNTLDLSGDKFFIQLFVSKDNNKGKEMFAPFTSIYMEEIEVIQSYKYLLGPYSTRESADKDHRKAQENGFRDAYILHYIDGKIKR